MQALLKNRLACRILALFTVSAVQQVRFNYPYGQSYPANASNSIDCWNDPVDQNG